VLNARVVDQNVDFVIELLQREGSQVADFICVTKIGGVVEDFNFVLIRQLNFQK